MTERKRILTGIRPTGASASRATTLARWRTGSAFRTGVRLLLPDRRLPGLRLRRRRSPVCGTAVWQVGARLAGGVGLDPEGSHFFDRKPRTRARRAHHLALLVDCPSACSSGIPTLKSEMEGFGKKSVPVAFFNYPVMQVANILMPRAHLVPVGEDQLPHIEMTREIARRFNRQFKEVFPEPEGLVGRVPRLVGTDGQGQDEQVPRTTPSTSATTPTPSPTRSGACSADPHAAARHRPRRPRRATPIILYLSAFDPGPPTEVANDPARSATPPRRMPNKVLKERKLTTVAQRHARPHPRPSRASYEANMTLVKDVLEAGTKRARARVKETIELVRHAPGENDLTTDGPLERRLEINWRRRRRSRSDAASNARRSPRDRQDRRRQSRTLSYREVPGRPRNARLRLPQGEDEATYSFLLESVEGGERLARYSFIGTCALPRHQAPAPDSSATRATRSSRSRRSSSRFKAVETARPARRSPAAPSASSPTTPIRLLRAAGHGPNDQPTTRSASPRPIFLLCDSMVVFDHIHHNDQGHRPLPPRRRHRCLLPPGRLSTIDEHR